MGGLTRGIYRKKTVETEAVQFDGTCESVAGLMDANFWFSDHPTPHLAIRTSETLGGARMALPGDWIIKGVNGEFYPVKPEIFVATYELVALQKAERPDWRVK